jgi:hypothetical protein
MYGKPFEAGVLGSIMILNCENRFCLPGGLMKGFCINGFDAVEIDHSDQMPSFFKSS